MIYFTRPLLPVYSFFLACIFAFSALSAQAAEILPVKYVFLFIGDGMSLPQQQLGEEFAKIDGNGLKMSTMPYRALTTTQPHGNFITDSAAAGTAIACGTQTNNRMIGMDPDGKPLKSIAKMALESGRKVGILTSVAVSHATPASFYAHNIDRGNEYEIGLDLVESGFHYFGGGDMMFVDDSRSKRYRGNLHDLAQKAGYTICRTSEQVQSIKPDMKKVLVLTDTRVDLPFAIDVNDGNPDGTEKMRLADLTRQAVEFLDNPDGFFIMVEGGRIDHACHNNDAATMVREIRELDDAISVAFDFAKGKKPEEVLIVVTADHETGSLSNSSPDTVDQIYPHLLLEQKWSSEILFYKAMRFIESQKEEATFEDFKSFITEQTGLIFSEEESWQPGSLILTQEERRELRDGFAVSKNAFFEEGWNNVTQTMIRILNSKAGITWGGSGHSPLPVCTSVWGDQAREIAESIRKNTDIAKQLKWAVKPLSERE